jgi:heptosyltransferase-2
MPDAPSRVVVLAPNWLGDIVMGLPAVADIRHQFPAATLALAARGALATVYESVPGVDCVVQLAAKGNIVKRSRDDIETLRSREFETAILFPNSFYSAWVTARAGIPERWGYKADFRSALLTLAVRRPRGTIHRATYYQHLVRELGSPSGPLRPHVEVHERYRTSALRLLGGEGWVPTLTLVGLAPGAAFGFAKQWPPEHFGILARLLADRGFWSVLVGAAADRDAGLQVMSAFERSEARQGTGRLLNLIGRTDIHQLMGLMTYCRSLVGNDSGATYLAAAIGLPVVAIYGPTDVRVASPLPGRDFAGTHRALSHPVFCSPCWLRECPIDHRCMTRIQPARVFNEVLQQLLPREDLTSRESTDPSAVGVSPLLKA